MLGPVFPRVRYFISWDFNNKSSSAVIRACSDAILASIPTTSTPDGHVSVVNDRRPNERDDTLVMARITNEI